MGDKEEVTAAIEGYYRANLAGESREGFWVQDERVIAMHPRGGRQTGWKEVGVAERSWPEKLKTWVYKDLELRDVVIHVRGDLAWAVFTVRVKLHVADEEPLPMEVRVSNVYERHGSEWLIVMHHDSITDLDVLRRLRDLQ